MNPKKLSEMTQEERERLVIDITNNMKRLKKNSPEWNNQMKILNMMSKTPKKKIEFHDED